MKKESEIIDDEELKRFFLNEAMLLCPSALGDVLEREKLQILYNTLQKIVKRSAMLLKVPIEEEAAAEISRRSRGTPRIANSLLRRVRDFAQVKGNGTITYDIAESSLRALNIDQYGLDEIDNKILTTIIDKFHGGPVGVGTIATAIGEDAGTIEEVYEPYLIMEGFIKRTSRGRMATKLAYDHLGRNPYGSNIMQGDLFE